MIRLFAHIFDWLGRFGDAIEDEIYRLRAPRRQRALSDAFGKSKGPETPWPVLFFEACSALAKAHSRPGAGVQTMAGLAFRLCDADDHTRSVALLAEVMRSRGYTDTMVKVATDDEECGHES